MPSAEAGASGTARHRILHLSDPHVTRTGLDEDGVDAIAALERILHDARHVPGLDLVVVSGDIADALLLLVLMYVAFVDRSDAAVSVIGPIHGLGFLALLYLTSKGAMEDRWGWWFPAIVLITGGPLGSILGDMRLRRETE